MGQIWGKQTNLLKKINLRQKFKKKALHKTTAASSSAMHTIVAHFTDARVLLASDL